MRSKRENGKLFVELSHEEEKLFLALLKREQRDFEERMMRERKFEDSFFFSIIKETRHCISCVVSLFLGYGNTEYEIKPDILERVSTFVNV